MKRIVGNWKANKTLDEAKSWWSAFSSASFQKKSVEVIICPPAIYVFELHTLLRDKTFPFPVKIGLQDISAYPGGTYTGEITGRMVKGVASYVILGHSERRRWLGETNQSVTRKVIQALDNHIVPIISVDRNNYDQQINQFEKQLFPKLIFMYEPEEAISKEIGPIGQGQSADKTDVENMVKTLKARLPKSQILYGGSVKSHNIKEYLSIAGVDGVVPGTASMNVEEFIKLINAS